MADREQPTSRAVAGVFGPLRSALYQIRLDQQPSPSLAKIVAACSDHGYKGPPSIPVDSKPYR
ncbi:hypothetical protein AVEN_7148-1, partial [Araneus ventricosus]